MNLHFLHGFLGFKSDWNEIKNGFHSYSCIAYSIEDYLPKDQKTEEDYFKSWAQKFNHHVFGVDPAIELWSDTQPLDPAVEPRDDTDVLIGYSLGGRLALHSLAEANRWDAVIIISANPGLQLEQEKEARIQNDEAWGRRFLYDPWSQVMQDWNSQGVFTGQKNSLNREENLYNKADIYKIITGFSLGRQKDLRSLIKDIQIPILWISGEQDTKFANIGKEICSINSSIKSIIVPGSGHRVPWEQQSQFQKICNDFLHDVYMIQGQ